MTATFRFYQELNDFLPPGRRQRDFAVACAREATTKHMIEALGAPHTEVDLVLVNGEVSGMDRILRDGDRVSVYPAFTALPSPRAPDPLPHRFIADAHLGGLARLLRMAGFDTLYDNNFEDSQIVAIARREERIVLTRDRDLLKRREVKRGCYVRAIKSAEQLGEIARRLALVPAMRPFTLCLACNAPLRTVAKQKILDKLPPAVQATQEEFCTCDVCHGIFWKGSHWRRMREVLAASGLKDAN